MRFMHASWHLAVGVGSLMFAGIVLAAAAAKSAAVYQ